MDSTKAKTTPTTPSLHSRTSSGTLTTKPDPSQNQPASVTGKHEAGPARYVYHERVGAPNPNAQPKRKSKFSKLLSKFQSPAVKQTNAARERELLEQERTGVKTYTPLGTPGSTNQATAAFL